MAKPRTEPEASTHRPLIAAYYLKGLTQGKIAELIGVSIATVNRDIKLIRQQWQESQLADMDAAKQRELERIDVLEYEAWQAWLRSQADSVSETENAFGGGHGSSTTRKNQYGDPRFLAIVDKCIERRCKILGIEAPVKTDNHHDGELTITVIREEVTEP